MSRPKILTATRRENGPPTSCDNVKMCGERGIYGFDVMDTEHGIHRVLCADCAMDATGGVATQEDE